MFDRGLKFHRFFFFFFTVDQGVFYSSQLVFVSVMRNSWDGSCLKGWTILREAWVKGLEEMFKSSLVFQLKLSAPCCQGLFCLNWPIRNKNRGKGSFHISVSFVWCVCQVIFCFCFFTTATALYSNLKTRVVCTRINCLHFFSLPAAAAVKTKFCFIANCCQNKYCSNLPAKT